MILNLEHIYKDYQQDKLVVSIKGRLLTGRRG